jgi:membrane-associated phospholipid phosphatase
MAVRDGVAPGRRRFSGPRAATFQAAPGFATMTSADHEQRSLREHTERAEQATADRTPIEQADAKANAMVAPLRDHPAVRAASAMTELADQPPLVALSLAVAAAGLATRQPRLARAGIRMLLSHALATGAKSVVKNNVDRSRPAELIDHDEYRLEKGRSKKPEMRSFPSGHSAGGVAVVRALRREYPGTAIPAGIGMGALVLALIPKQAHYPSDVAAGSAIGWGSEAIVNFAWERVAERFPRGALAD